MFLTWMTFYSSFVHLSRSMLTLPVHSIPCMPLMLSTYFSSPRVLTISSWTKQDSLLSARRQSLLIKDHKQSPSPFPTLISPKTAFSQEIHVAQYTLLFSPFTEQNIIRSSAFSLFGPSPPSSIQKGP